MKLSLSVLLCTSLLTLAAAACSAPDGTVIEDEEVVANDESELNASSAASYGGTWKPVLQVAPIGDFLSLELRADKRYVATLSSCAPSAEQCPEIANVEQGAYSLIGSAAKPTLRLAPDGGKVRRYRIAFAATVAEVGAPRALELTRSGKTQQLVESMGSSIEECVRAGCGGTLCVEPTAEPIFGTCEVRPSDACYQNAACARQADGQCGFAVTPELTLCLAAQ